MQSGIRDIQGGRVLPGILCSRGDLILAATSEILTEGSIVVGTGHVNGYAKVSKADADTQALAGGPLYIATHDVAVVKTDKPQVKLARWAILTGVNTNGSTVGNPVYLSGAAGGWTLTAPSALTAFKRVIGTVLKVSATAGVVLIDGSSDVGLSGNKLGQIVSGTDQIAIGQSSKAVAVGTALNGKPVTAIIYQAAADATLTSIVRAFITGGNLTVYGNTTATAAVTFAYIIDGR